MSGFLAISGNNRLPSAIPTRRLNMPAKLGLFAQNVRGDVSVGAATPINLKNTLLIAICPRAAIESTLWMEISWRCGLLWYNARDWEIR